MPPPPPPVRSLHSKDIRQKSHTKQHTTKALLQIHKIGIYLVWFSIDVTKEMKESNIPFIN